MRRRLTWVFIVVSVAFFLLDIASGRQLSAWGAKSPYIWFGEWHRLIVATFLHADLIHLALNMYALYIFGLLVEDLAGSWRFAFVYLAADAIGYMVSLLAHPESQAVGASAAIFGLMGYTLHYRLRRLPRRFLPIDNAFLQIIGLNLVLGLLVARIDQWAHVGGFLGGMLAASLAGMPAPTNRLTPFRWERLIALVLVAVLAVAAVYPAWVVKALTPIWPAAARWADARYGQYTTPLWAEKIMLLWTYTNDGEWAPAPAVLYPRPGRQVQLSVFWYWRQGQAASGPVPYRVIWQVREEGKPVQEHVDSGLGVKQDADPAMVYYRSGVLAQSGEWTVRVEVNGRPIFERTVKIAGGENKGV